MFDWIFLTLDGAAVHTLSGLPILPQGRLKDLGFVDYLFVLS
ncbi:MAG TPA: AraC family transcriptional regulator, partial [Rhodobacteraceae bacterium]|nr:AraC family transcriptional regulator [Paracoccaceae bacterium]